MRHVEHGYGYYPGGDPRNFFPDLDCCTPEELARHKAACEAWDRGEKPDPGSPHIPLEAPAIGHITVAHYGLGGYTLDFDCEGDPDCCFCPPPDAHEVTP